jgi:hypothetical protein
MPRGDSDVGAMIGLVRSGKRGNDRQSCQTIIDWQCTGVRLCLLCPSLCRSAAVSTSVPASVSVSASVNELPTARGACVVGIQCAAADKSKRRLV